MNAPNAPCNAKPSECAALTREINKMEIYMCRLVPRAGSALASILPPQRSVASVWYLDQNNAPKMHETHRIVL